MNFDVVERKLAAVTGLLSDLVRRTESLSVELRARESAIELGERWAEEARHANKSSQCTPADRIAELETRNAELMAAVIERTESLDAALSELKHDQEGACTPAERAVLDAMSALSPNALECLAKQGLFELSQLAELELARRESAKCSG